MFWDDIQKKRRVLESDEAYLAWQERFRRGWATDEEFTEALDRIYKQRMEDVGLDPDRDELAFPLASQSDWPDNPEILLGYALNRLPIGTSIEDLCRAGFIVVGPPGCGKSTFITHIASQLKDMENVSIWCYETSKSTLQGVFINSDFIIIPESLLRLNTCREPQGVNPLVYHGQLPITLSDTHGMLEKGWAVLQNVINELDSEYGIERGNPRRSSELDIYRKMEEKREQIRKVSIDEREALSRWLIKFSPFERYPEQFGSDRILDLHRLLEMNVIFKLTEFPRNIQSHIINSLELWTLMYKQHNLQARKIINIRIIDEAMNLVSEDISLRNSFIYKGMKLGRQYGLAYILGEQQPLNVRDVLGLAQAVVIMRQNDFTLKFFDRNMLIPKEQIGHLKFIPVGHAIISLPEKPLTEVVVPYYDISGYVSDEEVERRMRPLIEDLLVDSPRGRYEPKVEVHREGDMWHERRVEILASPDERKAWEGILKYIAENPLSGVTEVLEANELKTEAGYRMLRSLEKLEYIQGPVEIPSKGKSKKAWALTAQGARFVNLDWNKVRLKGRGSLQSKLYAIIIFNWIERNDGQPEYEFTLTKGSLRKQVDVVDLNDGSPISYELENSPQNSHVLENIRRDHLVGYERTVLITRNENEKKQLIGYLDAQMDPTFWPSIDIRVIKEFV